MGTWWRHWKPAQTALRSVCASHPGLRPAPPHTRGHDRPEVRTSPQAPGLPREIEDRTTSWHYRSGKIKISARKNVRFGDGGREGEWGAAWGVQRWMPPSQVGGAWAAAFPGVPVARVGPLGAQAGGPGGPWGSPRPRPTTDSQHLPVQREGPPQASFLRISVIVLPFGLADS